MIFIALGANLPHPRWGAPRHSCDAALRALTRQGVRVLRSAPWYVSDPVPTSDQPSFVNGVAQVATPLAPEALLALLHAVEAEFGRVRAGANAARTLDLDLLDYDGRAIAEPDGGLILPHPGMHARAFVLLPLRDIAPAWRHPVSGADLDSLIAALPADQNCVRLA